MVDRISHSCRRWANFRLSSAAKHVLINSSLLSIPMYTFSIYPILDTILSYIIRVVRNLFWAKDCNGKDIHYVAWRSIIESKAEGGLGVRNIALAKYYLMAKNIFKYLNHGDEIWVDILYDKYGKINFWRDPVPSKCSWFFRGFCNPAYHLK